MEELGIVGIAIISGIAGALIVSATNAHYQRNNLQVNTFTTIFKMLSDKEHWTARRNVLKSYQEFIKNETPDLSLFNEEDMRIVRSDFDQIGVMIYKKITKEQVGDKHLDENSIGFSKGFIPKNLFFEEFSGSVVNSWHALEYIIKFQRHHTYSERFMLFFEQLFEDAKDYRQYKSSLQKEREDDDKVRGKIERWIENIPNMPSSEVKKIKNY